MGSVVSVGVYAVAWVISIGGLALLGEATRRAGEVFGARVATWGVLLAVMGFLAGALGAILATA
jgi:hypothetical protein